MTPEDARIAAVQVTRVPRLRWWRRRRSYEPISLTVCDPSGAEGRRRFGLGGCHGNALGYPPGSWQRRAAQDGCADYMIALLGRRDVINHYETWDQWWSR